MKLVYLRLGNVNGLRKTGIRSIMVEAASRGGNVKRSAYTQVISLFLRGSKCKFYECCFTSSSVPVHASHSFYGE